MVKKEYRGQRSAESLANFIREELKDPVIEHNTLDELDELDVWYTLLTLVCVCEAVTVSVCMFDIVCVCACVCV